MSHKKRIRHSPDFARRQNHRGIHAQTVSRRFATPHAFWHVAILDPGHFGLLTKIPG